MQSRPQFQRRLLLLLLCLGATPGLRAMEPTSAPNGPYRVSANRILDRDGRPYLIRGTTVAAVTLDPLPPGDLGGLSASAFVTIRQRLNMNAIRLPLLAGAYQQSATFRDRVKEIVHMANRLELLAILAPEPADAPSEFWTELATAFRENPDVFFAVGAAPSAVTAIRAAGARQPILGTSPVEDADFIREAAAHYATTRSDRDRDRQFGALAERQPVLVDGLDPELGQDSPECAAFPADPADATRAVQANLDYFDAHAISWTLSAFRPGHLISDTRYFNGTKLDDGWTCGHPAGMAGIGVILLSHLWHSDPHGLFVVNGNAGSLFIPRGGKATTYGPILADREMFAGPVLPITMGNVSVRISDSRGVARLAPLVQTGAGWSYLTFIVPDEVAPGPAEFAIVRTDGSISRTHAILADVAPGLQSASLDGRGPAKARVLERLADGSTRESATAECSGYICRTVPISLSRETRTTLRVEGTGFRHARSKADFQVMAGDVTLPVISFGEDPGVPGGDQITVELPANLAGRSETDLLVSVDGRLSNVVRIQFGGIR